MFKEGAGIVLLFLMVGAIVGGAILGALTALLPAVIATFAGNIALLLVAFAVAAFIADKRRSR